jgi:hypothetical protein
VVAVEHREAFIARYGDAMLIAGKYSDDLSNGGDHVILSDGNDQTIHDFTYSDDPPWPTIADGSGPSLEVVDTSGNYGSASNWRASASSHGTPGLQTVSQPGDFDFDTDVDGADFLAWQRGFGTSYDSNDLDDWEFNFGEGNAAPVSAQPGFAASSQTSFAAEPTSLSPVGPLGFFSLPTISPLGSSADDAELERTVPIDLAFEQLHRPGSDPIWPGRRINDHFVAADSARSEANVTDDDRRAVDEFWDAAFDEVARRLGNPDPWENITI